MGHPNFAKAISDVSMRDILLAQVERHLRVANTSATVDSLGKAQVYYILSLRYFSEGCFCLLTKICSISHQLVPFFKALVKYQECSRTSRIVIFVGPFPCQC